MMKVPKHISDAFPAILNPRRNHKVSTKGTAWLEAEIVFTIFQSPPKGSPDEFREPLVKALGSIGAEALQVSYIKAIAKHLAEAVTATPLPKHVRKWLDTVDSTARKLGGLLSQKPKRHLPSEWNNLFSIVSQVLKAEVGCGYPNSPDLQNALRTENRNWGKRKAAPTTHGKTDLVAVLKRVSSDVDKFEGASAINYYQFPQDFFDEVSEDTTLFLAFQRQAIRAISAVNQEYVDGDYDSMTAHLLSCLFQKTVTKQNVKKIRETLEAV